MLLAKLSKTMRNDSRTVMSGNSNRFVRWFVRVDDWLDSLTVWPFVGVMLGFMYGALVLAYVIKAII